MFWEKIYCYNEDTLFVYLVLQVLAWKQCINFCYKFWVPIVVNCYQIEPGYIPEICIFVLTQKYTWSRLSKFMYLFSNSEDTWSRFSKLMHLFSNSEIYLKYISFQKKSRSINEVPLKYKQSTFLFFSIFILHLYFFYILKRPKSKES